MIAKTTPPSESSDHAKLVVEIWKKIVQTQEHFNEMCMRVRTMFATVMAAILSLYGLILKNGETTIRAYGMEVNVFILLCFSISVTTYLFYFVDRHWYHRLLVGSVNQGSQIERDWAEKLPEIQLGSKISAASPVPLNDRKVTYLFCRLFVRDPKLKQNKALHSDGKIEIFYKPLAWLGIVAGILAVLTGGIKVGHQSLLAVIWNAVSY